MLQWADNFSQYGVGGATQRQLMLDGLYAQCDGGCSIIVDPDPTASGNVLSCNVSAFDQFRKVLSGNRTRVGIAVRVWLPALPLGPNAANLIRLQDPNNANQVALAVTPTGSVRVYRGEGWSGTPSVENVLLAESDGPVLVASAWNHIEFWATIGAADTGAIKVVINGRVTAIEDNSVTTKNTLGGSDYIAQFNLSAREVSQDESYTYYFKDLVAMDSTGDAPNDFVGTVTVVSCIPDSDDVLTWTPSTGAEGWPLIDEVPPNDADYIWAGDPPPAPSRFGMTDLPEDVTSVIGIVTVVRARKTDGGDGSLQIGLVSGTDVDLGADRPITTAFTYWYDVSVKDPATDAPWTPNAVDNALLQVDRTV